LFCFAGMFAELLCHLDSSPEAQFQLSECVVSVACWPRAA
jgi:hypothetical protein